VTPWYKISRPQTGPINLTTFINYMNMTRVMPMKHRFVSQNGSGVALSENERYIMSSYRLRMATAISVFMSTYSVVTAVSLKVDLLGIY